MKLSLTTQNLIERAFKASDTKVQRLKRIERELTMLEEVFNNLDIGVFSFECEEGVSLVWAYTSESRLFKKVFIESGDLYSPLLYQDSEIILEYAKYVPTLFNRMLDNMENRDD